MKVTVYVKYDVEHAVDPAFLPQTYFKVLMNY